MKKIQICGYMLLLCLSAACNKNDTNSDLSGQDKAYMDKITHANLGEIDAGNIALQRAVHPAIHDFGSKMVQDHSAAHQELTEIAMDKDYALPDETDQEHKDMADMLSMLNGSAFDSTYIYMMIDGHDKAIALEQDEIANGHDEAVKNYAAETLQIIQRHRNIADSLAHALFP